MADLVASGELPAAIGVEVESPDVKPLIINAAEAASKPCGAGAITRSIT